MQRRTLLLAAGAASLARPALADTFPSRPIRLLIGFAAGGPGDILARIYAKRLQELFDSPVIVDNRPGASQLIAIHAVTSAPPDGHTLMLATGSGLVQRPGVSEHLPYDPLRDFALIGMVATTPGLLYAGVKQPFRTFDEWVAYARVHPGKLNYGSAGVASAGHFQMEYLRTVLNLDLVHVPYRSDQEVAREVVTGALQVALTTVQPALPFVASGELNAIAVTGAKRLPLLPNTPCLAETKVEQLRGIDYYTFYGLVGPSKLPAALITRLNAAINQIGVMPDVVAQMKDFLAFDAVTGTPDQFRDYVTQEIPKWRAVGKVMNLPELAN